MSAHVTMNNDAASLTPRTSFDGRALAFDFPALRIGVAEYDEGPYRLHRVPLSGRRDHRRRRARRRRRGRRDELRLPPRHLLRGGVPLWPGGRRRGARRAAGAAPIQDRLGRWFPWSAARSSGIGPGATTRSTRTRRWAGPRCAARSAGRLPLGARGAGRSASVGKWLPPPHRGESAGQGAAFFQAGPTKVLVFTVVNAMGAIIDRQGNVVRGHYEPGDGPARAG